MKKLFAIVLVLSLLFVCAACGEPAENGDGDNTASTGETVATEIKIDGTEFNVGMDSYFNLASKVTVEPKDAAVTYASSDNAVATVSKKGEVTGVATGTATITVSSGELSATCTVKVQGVGTIVVHDPNGGEGGIANKRIGYVESADDTDAVVVIISKSISATADKSNAVALKYNESGDPDFTAAYDGYYVTKTNNLGEFKIENVPEGDYVALIISSKNFGEGKNYSGRNLANELKATALGSVLSADELSTIAANTKNAAGKSFDREVAVVELTVKANETAVCSHGFAID